MQEIAEYVETPEQIQFKLSPSSEINMKQKYVRGEEKLTYTPYSMKDGKYHQLTNDENNSWC